MPGSWNPQEYRERAQRWLAEADTMPPGENRKACMTIAEGYSHLADLIERDGRNRSIRDLMDGVEQSPGQDAPKPSGGGGAASLP
jgi:hypothetical protein